MTNSRIIRSTLFLAAVLATAIAVSGCGEKSENVDAAKIKLDRVTLLLDWTPNADHAGIYTANSNGDFKQQALQVAPQVPSDPAAVIKQVAAGRADLGISYTSEVLKARESGAKVRAVAALVPTPLNSIIWLKKSGIKNIKDLKGKTVGVSGDGQSSTLETILKKNGVDPKDVKQVNVGYDLQKYLVSGKVDATITGYWNVEGVQLKQAGLKATVVPVDKAGSPTYNELVVIASEDSLKDGRRVEIYRRFLAGLKNGTAAAVANPSLPYAAIAKAAPDIAAKAADKAFLKESIKVTLPVMKQQPGAAYGYMDPTVWDTYGKWMHDNGLLKETGVNYVDAIDNDLLPGVGPTAEESSPNGDDDTGSVNSQ
ncbi:MAG: ABC transporter substrate-binding protein [Solirubrobacterales bacterium]